MSPGPRKPSGPLSLRERVMVRVLASWRGPSSRRVTALDGKLWNARATKTLTPTLSRREREPVLTAFAPSNE
jgi:hypothetical protein